MATKVGEAYVEIYPNINRALRQRAVAQVAKDMRDAYNRSGIDENNITRRTVDENTRIRARGENNVREGMRRTDRERNRSNSDQLRAMRKILGVTRDHQSELHKLATGFRTIGTLTRGIGISSAILSSWGTLELAIGGIVAALPVMNAGLAIVPGVLASAGATGLVLAVAFHGIGDALSKAAKGGKGFQDALDRLAPSARRFVLTLLEVKKALPNIQQEFFAAPEMQKAGSRLKTFFLGIRNQLSNLTKTTGGLTGALLGTATNKQNTGFINTILANTAKLLKTIQPGLQAVITGFLKLAAAGSGVGAKGLNTLLINIGKFLGNVNVQKVWHEGVVAMEQFKTVGKLAWDIIKGIGQALGGTEGLRKRFFSTMIGFLGRIDAFVNSGVGQQFLKQLFGVLNVLSGIAGQVISSGLKFLAGLLAALWPAIKPFGEALKAVLKALEPLGPVIGKVLAAALGVLTDVLKKALPYIEKFVKWAENNPDHVLKLAAAILTLYGAFATLKTVVKGASGIEKLLSVTSQLFGLGALGGPALIFVGALLAVGAAYIIAYNESKDFRDSVKDLKNNYSDLNKEVKKASGNIVDFNGVLKGGIVASVIGPVKNLGLVVRFLSNEVAFANLKWQLLKRAFVNSKDFFQHTVPQWFGVFSHNVAAHFSHVRGTIHSWWSEVANFFTGKVKGFFTKTVPNWFLNLWGWVSYAFRGIRGTIHNWWSETANFFTGKVKNFFTGTIPGWFNTAKSKILGAWDSVSKWTKDKWGKIKNFFTKNVKDFFVHTIPGWASSLSNSLNVIWDNIRGWATRKWIGVYNSIRDIVVTLINKVFGDGIGGSWGKLIKAGLGLVGQLGVDTFTSIANKIPRWDPNKGLGKAEGGLMRGPGGPRDDKIPAWLSNGEFVINAAATAKHYSLLKAINDDKFGGVYNNRIIPGFARGGAVGAIEALQRAVGPSLRVTSTTGGRHASGSYHYRGMAVDFAGTRRAMDAAATNLMKFSSYILELIHSPNWFVKNYRRVGRGTYASVYAGHFNHVHLAMSLAAAQQALADKKSGKIRGFVGFGPGGATLDPLVSWLHTHGATAFFKGAYGNLDRYIPNRGNTANWHALGKQPINAAVTLVNQKVQDAINTANQMGATNLGRMSGAVGSWIGSASKFVNLPANWVPLLRKIIQRESGGNPRSINLWDSNFRAGHPSKGLMQMIWPTFRANHARGTSWNMFDPVASIAAAINYIRRRYGTIFNTPWGRGTGTYYAKGGPVMVRDHGGPVFPGMNYIYNGTGATEWINNPQQSNCGCSVQVYVDGVDVTGRSHVVMNNRDIINSMNKRSGR